MTHRGPILTLLTLLTALAPLWASVTEAQEGPVEEEGPVEDVGAEAEAEAEVEVDEGGDVYVTADAYLDRDRSTSRVTREDMQLRMPRSTPDALRYEPGVYVQQTAHSQGSAYIRGRTGQQTVLLFDDVRLNNSLFRQGPNQYFFTIDSKTVRAIDVLRGSASTRYGSDAISGVLHARPIEPNPTAGRWGGLTPRLSLRHNTADGEVGGRLQLDAQVTDALAVVAGAGYRDVGQLESGGPVLNPRGGALPEVPRFEPDGRTQRGTGFEELTADVRAVYRLSADYDLTVAAYDYRQFDAPRTDQCAPAYAPFDDCLRYDEQFRTVAYGALDFRPGSAPVDEGRLVLSYQLQHERRTLDRPSSFVINGGRDDVGTLGALVRAQTAPLALPASADVRLRYGADAYHDSVESVAWLIFTDIDVVRDRSRGQYLDGSTYAWGGSFAELELHFLRQLNVRAGMRGAFAGAEAPGDPDSGTEPVDRLWGATVANVGVSWWVNGWLTLQASVDQGFRAPNLDDLTSRQQTGPGFQFENPSLEPERAVTSEFGAQILTDSLELEGVVYWSSLRDAIARAPRNDIDCPIGTSQCQNSWARFQLVNLKGEAVIFGAEATARVLLPLGFSLRTTVAYARGDGPNPQDRPAEPSRDYQERVPLSRIPPLNGTFEGIYKIKGAWAGFGLRWATTQDRLALSDISDERIPKGGTPGYATLDLRGGYRLDRYATLGLVFENVTDAAYRYHGSSVNGPARSLNATLELSY